MAGWLRVLRIFLRELFGRKRTRALDVPPAVGLLDSAALVDRSSAPRRRPAKRAVADTPAARKIEYAPHHDGAPDPGEVVWAWVSYEDDPSQGKDRPVLLIGRRGKLLVGVALTSKSHSQQIEIGSGSWDAAGRTSYAKVGRLLDIAPEAVRREGAQLDRKRFGRVVAAIQRLHGLAEK